MASEPENGKRRLLKALANLTYRDGFWFLFGAILGCHAILLINHLVDGFTKSLGGP